MGTVLTGARIPESLQKELKKFCRDHGFKISYVVSRAIEEKIKELKEDERDLVLFQARKDEPDISEDEMNSYLKSRGVCVL